MDNLSTLQSRFPNAENDLRERITKAMEQVIQPLPFAVPVAAFCSPTHGEYRVTVSSRWLPDKSFEKTFSEASLQSLDTEWQKFCDEIAKAFIVGPLKFH